MEKWKIGVIAALLLSLVVFGMYNTDGGGPPTPTPPANATPTPSPYDGKTLPTWNFTKWSTPKGVTVPSLKGSITFVEIFRTECSHCQEAAPMVVGINQRYGPRGLKMVGIQSPGNFKDPSNPENNWQAVKTWLSERGMKHPVAFDDGSKYFQGTIKEKVLGGDGDKLLYPTLLLVGPEGKIDWSQTGHDAAKAVALAVELEKLFPGPGTYQQRAQDLVKWLRTFDELANEFSNPDLAKALADDIARRLDPKAPPLEGAE